MSLNKHHENFLLDLGDSISFPYNQYCMKTKHKLQYKQVASNIKISAGNAIANCIGYINLSFKIDKIFYKHSFFLTSKFIGILGFDFLNAYRVVIDLHNNKIQINDNHLKVLGTIPEQIVDNMQDMQSHLYAKQFTFSNNSLHT